MTTFLDLNIAPEICEALRRQGIDRPTEVQSRVIPLAGSCRDIVAQSKTGSGKTLAYLLPVLAKVKAAAATQALIITPTRELAMQVGRVLARLAEATKIRSLIICGGRDIFEQKHKLAKAPQVVVGTPGRLVDHLRRRSIMLNRVNRVILDEADEMMKRGFREDIATLIDETAADRQLMMFSATMPPAVRALSKRYMNNPQEIIIKDDPVSVENIEQIRIDTQDDSKTEKLSRLLTEQQPYLAMVFCRTKKRAADLAMELAGRGFAVDELHGDLTQNKRNQVLKRFRRAELQILVATDLAARGLDIEGITHVYNYDLPIDAESYLHRIGRTGRAGQKGVAVTFVNSREYPKLRQIEAAVKSKLKKATRDSK